MKRIELRQKIQAPPQTVWEAITDHEGMVRWCPLKKVVLESEGSPQRNGVGAVRRMMGTGPTIVEKVVEFEAPHSYRYELTAGAPIRDHKGQMRVQLDGDDTLLLWDIEFRPLVPGTGWLIVAILNKALGGSLKKLARLLEENA